MRSNIKTINFYCKNCNKQFTKLIDSNKVHCSDICKIEFRAKNKKTKITNTKNCPKCGTEHTNNGVFCSRKCSNSRVRSEEFKKKLSEWAKENPRGFVINQNPNNQFLGAKAIREKWNSLRQTIVCKECQKEFEVAYSNRSRKYCSVECSNKNKYHINSNRKKRSIYKGYKMDSGAELIFAQQCDLLGIKWLKNTTQFYIFINSDGKKCKYYPDFYLEEYEIWVEIKGRRYIRPDDALRRAAVDKPVFLIISNQFKQDFDQLKQLLNIM